MTRVELADVLHIPLPDKSVDLCFTSPPYEDSRFYAELDFRLRGPEWVNWAVPRFLECLRVTKGLCCWVVQGRTRGFQWSGTPILLMAELLKRGVHLRCPPIYHRVGIPGSGGPDFWRGDYEVVVCATHGGKLPWSDNTASGAPPKYRSGGAFSHRGQDGARSGGAYPSNLKLANPGNVIHCAVGGGKMGSSIAHETEAAFPESLVERFVLSFCPPSGICCDPMCGSGTVGAVALKHGRRAILFDIRQSQVDLTLRRIKETLDASQNPLPPTQGSHP